MAVPRHLAEASGDQAVREVGAMTEDLDAFADWLVRLIKAQAGWMQRMQKALVQMNIQLTEVLSDVMG